MTLFTIFLVVSLLWLVMGSIINKIQSLWLTEPMIALFVGVIMGPVLEVIVIPENSEHKIMEWGALITIAMALMAAALKFRHQYIVDHKRMLSVLVAGGLLFMFLFSALIAHLALVFDWPAALLTGAMVTHTDPVVSASMISGKLSN